MATKSTIIMKLSSEYPVIAHSKIYFFYGWKRQILEMEGWKSRAKTRKLSFFEGNQKQLFQFCPGKVEPPFYTSLTQNALSIV